MSTNTPTDGTKLRADLDEARLRTVVALVAEIRLSEKAAVDLVARVNLGLGATKSPRHVQQASSPNFVCGIPFRGVQPSSSCAQRSSPMWLYACG